MTRRQFFVALVVLFVGGVLGGALSTWLTPGGAAWAQNSLPPAYPMAAVPSEVRAERFALVDATGRGRAALEIVEEGDAAFRIFDERGKPRIVVRMQYDQPQILLLDEAGVQRVNLGLGWDEPGPGLTLSDSSGRGQIELCSLDGYPMFWLSRDGHGGAMLDIPHDGTPEFTINTEDGDVLWRAP
jgi:hypothetical protein